MLHSGSGVGTDFAVSQADGALCTSTRDVDPTAAVNPPANPLAC